MLTMVMELAVLALVGESHCGCAVGDDDEKW